MKNSMALSVALGRKDPEAMKGAMASILYQEFHPQDEDGQALRAFCMRLLFHANMAGLETFIQSIIDDDDQGAEIGQAAEQWRQAWNRVVEPQ